MEFSSLSLMKLIMFFLPSNWKTQYSIFWQLFSVVTNSICAWLVPSNQVFK